MELRPGYKKTVVGVIPEEWKVAPLSQEIESFDAGVSVNSMDEDLHSFGHDESVLKTSAVSGGHFNPLECKKIAPRDLSRAKLNPRADSIIISRMNTPDLVGECGYVGSDYSYLFLPDRLWMTRIRNGSRLSVRWLSYLLSSKPYKMRIKGLATGTSGSMKNIAKDALGAMPIPFPEYTEQRAIAAALSDVDALLAKLDQLIAKKRDIKQAAMQQLLTGKKRLPGFSEEWEVKRLGDVGIFRGGSGFPTKHQGNVEGAYPFYKVSDMNNEGNSTFMSSSNNWITEEIRKQTGANTFPTNTIVFAKIGAAIFLERKKILTQESCIDNNMMGFVLDEKMVHHRFMHYLFLSIQLGRLVAATALPSLNGKEIAGFLYGIPKLLEQQAIAAVLSDMDAEIAALEARRDKTRDLKQGMMQELLTGRIRLV